MPFPSALLFLLLRQEEEERKGMRTRVSFCFVSLCDARGDVGRRFLEGGRRRRVVLVSLDVRRHRRRRRLGLLI